MRSFAALSIALALTLLLAPDAVGQSAAASVNMSGQVSGAVFVSIAPGAQLSGETLAVTYSNLDRQTVRLSIDASGSGDAGRRISIPLQLRSNVGYTLSASARLSGTTLLLRGLCVEGVRATGRRVAHGAVNAANIAACDDGATSARTRNANARNANARNASRGGFATPSTLLQGQMISLSGASDSPFNALEVLIRVEVETPTGQPQGSIELILSASPVNGAPAVMNVETKSR